MFMKTSTQLPLDLRYYGGHRKGAGRPKTLPDELTHLPRVQINSRVPMHITIKLREGVPGLREPKFLYAFARAIRRAARKGLRVQHFSIQSNHLHLIAEADSNSALRIGMCSLLASITWALRKIFQYWGDVFTSRYHINPIRVPRLMRNVLKYVLFNYEHHCGVATFADVYSSVFSFDGARLLIGREQIGVRPRWQSVIDESLSAPGSWMQRVGWRKLRSGLK